MRLFLVCGKAGSGKNEVAEIIKKNLDKTIVTAFSKYIKLFALELTDWDGNDNDKPRAYLQRMGDVLRGVDINFMTKRIYEDLKVYEHEGIENVVVSDVRLLNELNYFKDKSDIEVVTIRVNSETSKRVLNESEKQHCTEIELDNYSGFDYVVNNKFDNKLEEDVINILKGLK